MISKTGQKEWKTEFCTATGLSFSKTFRTKLEATTYERYLERTFGSSQVEVKEMLKIDYKPFTVNGCRVEPARTGIRCQGLRKGCERYDSCLAAIAKKGWCGSRVVKEEGFTYLNKRGGEEG